MKLARVRHRIMASLIDLVIMTLLLSLIFLWKLPFIISMFKVNEHVVSTKFIVDMFRWGIIFSVILIIYYTIIPLLLNGQTIGKKIFKLKITGECKEKIDFKTLFYREVISGIFISFASLGITALASVITMLLREDKKSIADIFAKTTVVDLYESEE